MDEALGRIEMRRTVERNRRHLSMRSSRTANQSVTIHHTSRCRCVAAAGRRRAGWAGAEHISKMILPPGKVVAQSTHVRPAQPAQAAQPIVAEDLSEGRL